MKKILLTAFLALGVFTSNAQSDFYPTVTGTATSGNSRAPQGSRATARTHWLITATEMADAGFVAGDVINGFGFYYITPQNTSTISTTFNVYMENAASSVVTNAKSSTWTTAISTMTTVSTNNITIPALVGQTYHEFSGGDSFVYSGGALYIAFDYANTGALATTGNVAYCSTSVTGGLKSVQGFDPTATTPSLGTSNFRPYTYLGKKVDCARPRSIGFENPTSTTVDLIWTGTGSQFELEYGVDGFTQGAGTTIPGISAKTQTLTGLTPSTVYNYYVRTDCGAGKTSVWKGPYPFYTAFEAVNPTYTESFESYDFPFLGWKADGAPNGTGWFVGYPDPNAKEGTSSAFSYNSSVAASTARLYSKGVNLKAGRITVKYWVNNDISASPAPVSTGKANYELYMGNAQTLAAQTILLKSETDLKNTTMEEKVVTYDLPLGEDGVYYFGFLNNSEIEPTAGAYHGISIDLFSVEQTTTLSNNEFLSSQFSVSPNPAKNVVNIANGENMEVSKVTVTDLNGRTVKNVSFDNVANVQVNVADLASGLYIMNITSNKGTATKKFVKN